MQPAADTARRWALRGVLLRRQTEQVWRWLARRTSLDACATCGVPAAARKRGVQIAFRRGDILVEARVSHCVQDAEFVSVSCTNPACPLLAFYFWSEAAAQAFMHFLHDDGTLQD